MKSKYKLITAIILIAVSTGFLLSDRRLLAGEELTDKLVGRILLQVEEHGEAWYVAPIDRQRYYLGRPDDAFDIMRRVSTGISNADIRKIPVAGENFGGTDTDSDGLSDAIEASLGTDPNLPDSDSDGYGDKEEILNGFDPSGEGNLPLDGTMARKWAGHILLQAEQNGETWYLNPSDGKRYFLGRPADAFLVMKKLALGITNSNLAMIKAFDPEPEPESEYNPLNILKKYTRSSDNSGTRRYSDPGGRYSLEYPNSWNIRRYDDDPRLTQITDAKEDYITEKRAVIAVYPLTTSAPREPDHFRVASIDKSTTLSDKQLTINDQPAYENSYQHFLAYEKTTTIQKSPTEFIRVTLSAEKSSYKNYLGIYSSILKSIEY